MSHAIAKFPFANNNARQPEPFLKEIAKEGDFFDKLRLSSRRELFTLRTNLENKVREFGDVRNPLLDMCRMRLTQLRAHLS
ncbi:MULTISPECIES: hypothetical protein [unclassified Variovorax]|uniref:hypothetical protein n=1 Tax=unclassified Variovorax TaxID=663243 RepID=UPI0013168BD1|nr:MULTISPECIES: hypothetical protein [unclassified Variovorax]VTU42016.1 hypothetical protein H6P1_00092 [Variovorax sp. PBL-H6]VTU44350.1 hypothetical protein SRS16P1_00810 [Variovorax sp. SRS16]VTU44394.1 hypothetical protein E5P1_00803 [Variovorax sp. PBL-E5]